MHVQAFKSKIPIPCRVLERTKANNAQTVAKISELCHIFLAKVVICYSLMLLCPPTLATEERGTIFGVRFSE